MALVGIVPGSRWYLCLAWFFASCHSSLIHVQLSALATGSKHACLCGKVHSKKKSSKALPTSRYVDGCKAGGGRSLELQSDISFGIAKRAQNGTGGKNFKWRRRGLSTEAAGEAMRPP